MNNAEATSNIIVAMINNKLLNSPEEIAKAIKVIYPAFYDPMDKR